LTHLFNLIEPTNASRLTTYIAVLEYAVAHKLVQDLVPSFKNVSKWAKQWGLNAAQVKDLHRRVYLAFSTINTNNKRDLFDTTLTYLRLYENAKPEELAEVADVAAHACTQAILLDHFFHFDELSELKAVQDLAKKSKSPVNQKAIQILNIFTSEDHDSYAKFLQANPSALKDLALDEAKCSAKIKILTLATLASSEPKLTYATVTEKLAIKPDEVELWVIRAINEKLLDAKLSPLTQTVHVSSFTRRSVKDVEWKSLQQKVGAWRENVSVLLQIMELARGKGGAGSE